MRSVKFLEQVKERYGLKSDAALAAHLNLSKSTVSLYMSGKRVMDEETCLAIALALEIDPARVLMAAGIDRAEKTGQKSLWEVFSQRMAAPAAVILGIASVTNFLTPPDAQAAPRLNSQVESIYIM